MFPQKFIFQNNEVRTNKIDETFLLLCKNSKGLKRIKKRDKLEKSNLSRDVPGAGIEPALSKELDFESSASTNSATRAFLIGATKLILFFE